MRSRVIGQVLMGLAALSAVGAFAGAVPLLADAEADRLWVESWRAYGFLVFAGLFALLAWRPTRSPLVWELVFFHKAAMVVTHLAVGDVAEAAVAGMVDLALCAVILVSWMLTRGWESWCTPRAG
ncbi:hypothetical protein H0274_08305 [Altererythrobacter sp. CC-YST694]|uniref:hypothetical protein n=1 Tax=Altererythrobacter sp. CC-YST694 TaxID=2755038 RepID=UPI001D01725B|nr:hypothetical protein [Altererythrobacter sp. CC-YST694]MCB5425256.1 hypothetical protein [Altererythrobacter sp. CC-YST694]